VGSKFHHGITDPEKVNDYGARRFEGLPAGRMWGGTSMEWMAREEPTVEAIIAERSPPNLKTITERYPGLDGWEVSVMGPRFETWCLGWFNHHTFDNGQDDLAVLASFERYVHRTQMAINNGHKTRCLMAAEERWRWRGEKVGEPAQCRCDGCKKCGYVRIKPLTVVSGQTTIFR
jgi:hypothetical protein